MENTDEKEKPKTEVHHKPSVAEKIIGVLFAFMVFALIATVIIGNVEVDKGKMNLLYVLIALMSGVFAATIPGFLNVDYSNKGLSMRAAGGAGAFVFVLLALQTLDQGQSGGSTTQDSGNGGNSVVSQPTQQFNATSYCSIANVYGYASHSDLKTVQDLAVQNCINNGGVPDCCANNVRVTN